VVLAGGSGFIGGEVRRLLTRLQYEVVVVGRPRERRWVALPSILGEPAPPPDRTWADIEADGLPAGTVAVINCAGQNLLDPLYRWNDAFRAKVHTSRVRTNRLLARAVEQSPAPPRALLSMSGVAVYPPGPAIHTEHSQGGGPEAPWLARLVTDWEAAAQLPAGHPTRVCTLRAGVVLGRRGGLVQQTILPFYFGLGGRMGPGDQVMPWIHVKDVARLMVHCIQSEDCSGVFNAVAPELVTNQQFVQAYAGELRRPALFPAPAWVFRLAFGAERAAVITDSLSVTPERTLQAGFQYQYPTVVEAAEEFAHLFYVDPDEINKTLE